MWKKKLMAARKAWEAAMRAANARALDLEAKGEITAEDKAGLDLLIEDAKSAKAEYDRIVPLAELEEQQETHEGTTGRKTRNGAGPGILSSGSRNQSSQPLRLSNIFK